MYVYLGYHIVSSYLVLASRFPRHGTSELHSLLRFGFLTYAFDPLQVLADTRWPHLLVGNTSREPTVDVARIHSLGAESSLV